MPEPPKRENPTQEDSTSGGGGNSNMAASKGPEIRNTPPVSSADREAGAKKMQSQVNDNEAHVNKKAGVVHSEQTRKEADKNLEALKQVKKEQGYGR